MDFECKQELEKKVSDYKRLNKLQYLHTKNSSAAIKDDTVKDGSMEWKALDALGKTSDYNACFKQHSPFLKSTHISTHKRVT